jgi:hypothetical protein
MLMGTVRNYSCRIVYLIMPPFEVWAANSKLNKKLLKSQDELEQDDERYINWYQISVSRLDDLVKAESERAAQLDDKAGKIGAVLALALTIGGAFGVSLIEQMSLLQLKQPVRIMLLLAIIYILMGGWLALFSGNSAKPQGDYGPDWEAELSAERACDKRPRVAVLVSFELTNLIRNNNISGALQCVRNGAALFFIVLALAAADPLIPVCIRACERATDLLRCCQLD